MAVEPRRGCGFRKVGGLYLVGSGNGLPCDRLPLPLDVCPVCSHGFKQSRGWTWVDLAGLVGGLHLNCSDSFPCPLCMDTANMGRAGLLWIGAQFYKSPRAFLTEANELGISRRIATIPRGFVLGETWVMFAHAAALPCGGCGGVGIRESERCDGCAGSGARAGIFYLWQPRAIETLLPESARDSETARELAARGITIVYVPDNDPDHQGTVYDKADDT